MVKYEEKTVGDSVESLTPATYAGANRAVIAVESNSIRFTCDGTTDPTEAVGFPMSAGDVFALTTLEQIKNFRVHVGAIASPVVPASLKVQYENNLDGFRTE